MDYDPEGESREVEYESEHRIRRPVRHSKMSRKLLHKIFWFALLSGAIITYIVMFFMGNPFSDVAGILIKGSATGWFITSILLWWANATTLYFAAKWYMSDYWYITHWMAYLASAAVTVGVYFFNTVCGVWLFFVLGGVAVIGIVGYADYFVLNKVIHGIDRHTMNDDPLYYEEEEIVPGTEEVSKKD